jgi:hypothetical protein
MPGLNDRGIRGLELDNQRLVMKGASWVEPQSSIVCFEDFTGDAINTFQTIVTQSGTPTAGAISATAGDPVAGVGGWLAGATDDVDAEIDEIAFFAPAATAGTFRADRAGQGMLVVEFGFTVPTALTARQYFTGFSDDPTEGTATNGALNIQTAYTLVDVADDAAGWVFSSLATAPTVWKWASTLAGTGSTVSASTEGVTQVADTAIKNRVELDSLGNAFFYQALSSGDMAYKGANALAVTPTVKLIPLFTAAPTTTTAVPWEIDYCFAACAR